MPKPIDYYYMFLSRALTNCDMSKKYLYDKNTDSLFRLINTNEEWIPTCNNYFSDEEKNAINNTMPRYRLGDQNIYLLDALSLDEMVLFVENFITQLSDEESKQIAKELLNPKDLISSTHRRPKSKEAFDVLWDYSFKLYAYFGSKYEQLYYPLGVNEDSLLIW